MNQQMQMFDAEEGRVERDAGMELAAANRGQILQAARSIAVHIAAGRVDRMVDADDVYRQLTQRGYNIDLLGNAAGSIFKGKEWAHTGQWKQSRRVSNHGRPIRVWRLK